MVRLVDDARKCVVYLGYPEVGHDKRIEPVGTGFFVFVSGENDDGASYLVTARHVAEELGADPFGVRLDQPDGRGRVDYVDQAEWFFHPTDNNVDGAVLPYNPPK